MQTEQRKPARAGAVLRAYGKAAARYPLLLAGGVIGVIVIESANVSAPLLLRRFIDTLTLGPAVPGIADALFWILSFFAAISLCGWLGQRLRAFSMTRIEAHVMSDLSNDAFGRFLGHSHEFFISNFTGTLTRRVMRYARSFEQVADNILFNFFPAFLFAAAVIIVLWQRNAYLGAGLLVWGRQSSSTSSIRRWRGSSRYVPRGPRRTAA